MSVTRLPDPAPVPTCPWCIGTIFPNEPTARVRGVIFHALCVEDMERIEAKEGPQ